MVEHIVLWYKYILIQVCEAGGSWTRVNYCTSKARAFTQVFTRVEDKIRRWEAGHKKRQYIVYSSSLTFFPPRSCLIRFPVLVTTWALGFSSSTPCSFEKRARSKSIYLHTPCVKQLLRVWKQGRIGEFRTLRSKMVRYDTGVEGDYSLHETFFAKAKRVRKVDCGRNHLTREYHIVFYTTEV